jgi:hypothetical protein
MRFSVVAALCLITLALAGTAGAGEIQIKEISSNSVLVDREKGITYAAENVLSSKAGEMWVEAEASSGLGKYVEVKFDGDQEVHSFRIFAGCFVDLDFWKRHNRIAMMEFKYPDFTSEKIELDDKMEGLVIKLAEPKTVSKIKIYLRQVHNGTTWNDTPITRLQFFDKDGPTEHSGFTATATSEYADEDNAYAVDKAIDGWDDTYWVNGEGDGKGESITVDLGGSKKIGKFGITMGFGDTESFFKGSNRVGEVTLSFSDGSSKKLTLKDTAELQVFEVDATTSTVKVTFTKVLKGDAHDDLYVGELHFWK